MIISSLMFYVFAVFLVFSGAAVVLARNPVHSVLFLILAFFNAAGLFVLLGAEYLAMALVVVYVGAVAVLFLFVVMMLDIDIARMRSGVAKYWPLGLVVGAVILAELIVMASGSVISGAEAVKLAAPTPSPVQADNISAIGNLLYTDFVLLFQAAGLILLVAMIGAIMLTLRSRPGVKKQNIARQLARRPEDTLEIKKVQSGGGV